ncbi:helix-turn-helix transcriptional regulator [Brevibacillus ginsengisoli]|uniref:helix-turn-helix transcriptional regulator n=1 Tax=Brevibacillus ginsengisoli TaxID=363854 RepID=UPI003CEBDFE5
MAEIAGRCLLKRLLRARKMSQQDLADKLGKPKSQISEYANGNVIMSLTTARNIAKALGCMIDELYEWIPSKE